ncbi:MAG TPA: patatin-like phospholipase family protein [Bacteroidales bacterium]|nr:patatin-like phospholipase family protein [Bacteroidales bacterium]
MKKDAVLVLSSGESRGLAQIGVINCLIKNGFNIKSVAGSSIGSIIGGFFSMGKLDDYANWVKQLDKKDVWGLMDFTLKSNGILKGEKVFDTLKQIIPDRNIEDLPIKFAAVATDIIEEKEIVFTTGSIYNAFRASVAIPAVFTPVTDNDTFLVDGGVLNPIPAEYVTQDKNDLLIIVNLYGKSKQHLSKKEISNDTKELHKIKLSINKFLNTGNKKSIGYYNLLSRTSSAMIHKIAELKIKQFNPDILIEIPHDSAKTFDFFKANGLIKMGEEIAQETIDLYFKKNN